MSRLVAGVISPPSQWGQNVLTTVSAILNSSTSSPTAITSPAPSDIGIRPSAHGIFPSTTRSSWKFSELARILTSSSPGLGLGWSSSTNLRFSKPPGALSLTSFMNIPSALPRHRRHLVEFRQGWIDVVPRVTAHAVCHHLRLVSTWIVKARGVHRENIRHGRERHIYG